MAKYWKGVFSDHGRERGQGLVEFALVLPALLLTLMGIADFGRLFAVYSNLFNAGREGARYGVVNPKDVSGIALTTRSHIQLVESDDVDVYVHFDSGPDTPAKDFAGIGIGDRVIVTLNADVEMLTPPIRAIVKRFHVETITTRTISTLGSVGLGGDPPAPPTSTPDNTTTPSPTATLFGSDTATPTPTGTADPVWTPTYTPEVTPEGVPIQIDTPLWDGDTVVTGVAQPGESIVLRDIQDPSVQMWTTVNGDGTFQYNLSKPLVAGHVIAVQGYGYVDYAVVEGEIQPTNTPFPTATPIPTATPTSQYIDVSPTCGPAGNVTISVSGHQWPTNKGYLAIYWDGLEVGQVDPPTSDFVVDITVSATGGTHTVLVETTNPGTTYSDAKSFEVPCPITPTPTPGQPNLVVQSIGLENTGSIASFDPLTFTVAVRNIGAAAANSLFWVDVYVDPAVEPPTPDDLTGEASVAWSAVSSLAAEQTISLTLEYPEGFAILGDHHAYAMADTWAQVSESDETDNVGGPVTVTVSLEGVPPTPTPTPTPGAVDTGAISGSTWLFISSDVVPQGRINVYCYDGDELIAETRSDEDGNYELIGIPPGTYMVMAQTFIDDEFYSDVVLNVQVVSGETTPYITLVLH